MSAVRGAGDVVVKIDRDLRASLAEGDGHRFAEAGGAAGHQRHADGE